MVNGEEVQVDAFGFHLAGVEGVHPVVQPAGKGHLKGCHFVMVLCLMKHKSPRSENSAKQLTGYRIRLEFVTASSDYVHSILIMVLQCKARHQPKLIYLNRLVAGSIRYRINIISLQTESNCFPA